ncbi:MAG: ferredoxin family protein [Nitrososphaerota archaeon]|nr:ferredoxin family protein [Nitrososphaerota archaeon]
MPPTIDKEKCVPCGRCVEICPTDVYFGSFDKRKIPQIKYPDECFHCDLCVQECPRIAITLEIPIPLRLWARAP